MKYTINDIIEVLSESTIDSLYNENETLMFEGYKKDPNKKKLARDYRKQLPKQRRVETDTQTYIQKPISDKESEKLHKLVDIMNRDDISDNAHNIAVNMYNNTIGSSKNSSVSTINMKVRGGKTITAPGGLQKRGTAYEISTRTYKPGKEIKIKSTDKLYHTSKIDNLTELKPTLKSTDGVQYSSRRIYFWLNKHGNRYGGDGTDDCHVYELLDKPTSVKSDTEIGGGAVYIETNKPLRVKKIK